MSSSTYQVSNASSGSITLSWAPNYAGGLPRGYSVRYRAAGSTLYQSMRSAVQVQPISGAGNFTYSGAHIRVHIATQAYLWRMAITPSPRTWVSS
ncbi:hypothetical protein E2C01_038255 [Portunus trituberculatus]|uniref:Fibronectin type-III domain-containing protein n=1 Tax=Portunus trituberculatus TaxID=210409 RepID=A0A5B7FI09_PORTR|nr:hypothetical protein [Portunus trituberculatus]